jgi:hypothetical protein
MRFITTRFTRSSLRAVAVAAAMSLAGTPFAEARAATVLLDFETRPSLPAQPSNFFDAGPMQTYSEAGLYSITGGAVLGNPNFLQPFGLQGSGPNLYGTTDIGDPSLLDTITLTLPGAQPVMFVGGVLFNGQPVAETYEVSYFTGPDGILLSSTQTFFGVGPASSSAGYANFSYAATLASPITRVTISTPNAGTNGWDFFVDTVMITSPIPEPSQGVLAGVGLAAILLFGRKQKRELRF